MDELKALVKLVSDSVDRIEKSCKARNVAFPSLAGTYSPESEAARLDPAVLQAAADISAATAQLSALVRPPPLTLITISRQVSDKRKRRTENCRLMNIVHSISCLRL